MPISSPMTDIFKQKNGVHSYYGLSQWSSPPKILRNTSAEHCGTPQRTRLRKSIPFRCISPVSWELTYEWMKCFLDFGRSVESFIWILKNSWLAAEHGTNTTGLSNRFNNSKLSFRTNSSNSCLHQSVFELFYDTNQVYGPILIWLTKSIHWYFRTCWEHLQIRKCLAEIKSDATNTSKDKLKAIKKISKNGILNAIFLCSHGKFVVTERITNASIKPALIADPTLVGWVCSQK